MKNKKSRDTEVDAKRKRNDDDSDVSDVESVGSVEFNDYLDNLMVGKRNPKSLNFAEDVESSKKKGKKKEEGSFQTSTWIYQTSVIFLIIYIFFC